ncbi:MAG: hypothetical protein RIS48_1727 [Pseudomonadota bacterium]
MRPISPLLQLSLLVAALAALPVASIAFYLLAGGTGATWQHLVDTVLADYILNSLRLCLGVAAGVILFGVSTAWLTAMHDFPGRRVFEWALVLPMAMPAYVLAYLYTDWLQFVGPVQTALREAFGWRRSDYWFPDVRSLGGAAAMFTLVLYPYVYLLARNAFLERSSGMLEAARTLGQGPWQVFWRISLPLARPAIAAGVALVLMETLADYGTVAYFGVDTFTTGIYRAWFSLGDRTAAAQLATLLLGFVVLLLLIERHSRGRASYHNTTGRNRPMPGQRLQGGRTWLARGLNRLVGLGYAVPGSVIAVGVLIPVTRLDHWLAAGWQQLFGHNPGLLLTGGIAALVYAYLVRFLSAALQTVEGSLGKITPSMDDAARSLGSGQFAVLRRVHLPILRGSLFTAGLLVFVDVMKELPATLVMRPFNFDTLATQTYNLASDERLAEASSAALAIVVVGLLPLILLSRQIARGRKV